MKRIRSATIDIVDRLRASSDHRYRQQTFLGFFAGEDHYPVLFPDSLWEYGLWVLGAARTGKTSRVLASLLYQRSFRKDCVIVVMDLKGDWGLFQLTKRLANESGREFLYYTNVPKLSTYLYNPLDQNFLDDMTRSAVAESLMTSLNLLYGPGYGKGYFGQQSSDTCSLGLFRKPSNSKWLPNRGAERVKNFFELKMSVAEVVKQHKELRGAEALTMTLRQMTNVFALNGGCCGLYPQSALDQSLQLRRLLQRSANGTYPILYSFLRAESEPTTAPMTGKLQVNQLKNVMQLERDDFRCGQRTEPVPSVALFIDECQHVMDEAFKNMLEQGASMGFQFVLANQDVSQLNTTDRDYLQTVWENCGNKIILSCRDPRFQEWLMKVSGEKPIHNLSYLVSGDNLGRGRITPEYSFDGLYQVAVTPGPRYERNHIMEMSDTQGRAMFIPAASASLAQYGGYPIVIDIPFLLSLEDFNELQNTPWPAPTPATVVPADYRARWEEFLASQR